MSSKIVCLFAITSFLWACESSQKQIVQQRMAPLKAPKDTVPATPSLEDPNYNDSVFCIGAHKSVRAFWTDSTLVFYEMKGDGIVTLSDTFKGKYYDFKQLHSEDIDFDQENELVATSPPNMNGNRFFSFFDWNAAQRQIVLKANMFGQYELDTIRRSIQYAYEGSWYMAVVYSKNIWCGEDLVCMKIATLSLMDERAKQPGRILLYEARKDCNSKLRTILKEPYDSARHEKLLHEIYQ